jgi:hypothetical protein
VTARRNTHRGAWRELHNATRFTADVAKLAINKWSELMKRDVREALELKLRENAGERLSLDDVDRATPCYREFRDQALWNGGALQKALVGLIDLVGKLWERPDRSVNSIANKVHRVYVLAQHAKLDLNAVTQLELHYRLLDLDPEQRLDVNQRLAFEAAWLSGQHTFARQLVERELKAWLAGQFEFARQLVERKLRSA